MNYYLVVYDRRAGSLLRFTPFTDADEALTDRFAAQAAHRGNGDIEIVVLGAESEATVRRTHGRYFYTSRELRDMALDSLNRTMNDFRQHVAGLAPGTS